MQGVMFGDHQPKRRQLVDLASRAQHNWRFLCQRGLAPSADRWPVFHDFIRRDDQSQRLTTVADLPTRLLPTPPPQTVGLARQPVT
jgi:hypothetical protein